MCSFSTTSFPPSSSPSIRPTVATRRGCSSATGRRATSGTGRWPICPTRPAAGSSSSTTPGSSPRASPCGGRAAARSRRCSSSASPTTSGRRSPARRAGSGWGRRSKATAGPSSCSSRSAAAGGGSASAARRTASCPSRPTSTSGSPTPSATRRSTRPRRARPRRRPRASTSRPSCSRGSAHERITLHVGLDTFRPVTAETLEAHELHGERYRVEDAAWQRIEAAEQVLAVGTTTTRVLETIARGGPLAGRSDLFITPGFRFQPGRRAADQLPPASHDAPRARDGLRRRGAHAGALRPRDPRAVPLLLLRRCDADPVTAR